MSNTRARSKTISKLSPSSMTAETVGSGGGTEADCNKHNPQQDPVPPNPWLSAFDAQPLSDTTGALQITKDEAASKVSVFAQSNPPDKAAREMSKEHDCNSLQLDSQPSPPTKAGPVAVFEEYCNNNKAPTQQPPQSASAASGISSMDQLHNEEPVQQPVTEQASALATGTESAHRQRSEQVWREEFLNTTKQEAKDNLENTLFSLEAIIGAAQHFVMAIPYRRMPLGESYDGTPFDPNPPNSLDPAEVSNLLAALKGESSGHLRNLIHLVTGDESEEYNIPAKVVSKAMTREGDESFSDKIRAQYQEEYQNDPAMRDMIQEPRKALENPFGPPPPHRLAAQPVPQAVTHNPFIKMEPENTATITAIGSTNGGTSKRSHTKSKSEGALAKQNYRQRVSNNVAIILEASDIDMIRTHRTPMGRMMWGPKGLVWPEVCTISADVSPEVWTSMSARLARYCPFAHESGWMVLVSGDITNCHECNKQNFTLVDIYLPPQTRFNILRRGYGVDEEGRIFNANDGRLLPQPNHLGGITNLSTTIWEEGKKFTRKLQPISMEIQYAVSQGKVDDLLKKMKTPTHDRWLLKNTPAGRPKLSKRKLTSNIKAELAKPSSNSPDALKKLHTRRLQHFWDLSQWSETRLEAAVAEMITRVKELHTDRILSEKQFDLSVHWFTRQDVVEIVSSKTLDSLLLELTGQGDPKAKTGRIKKSVEDADLAGIDLTQDSLGNLPKPVNSRKRKVESEIPRPPRPRKQQMTPKKAEAEPENESGDTLQNEDDNAE
ncbi:hypothetical protein DDE83_000139 [Stemphylium lycopersici]|uniref:Uncharacterized protein n=1 Tax=Stemphylium lycopersici TaxID=183478 RepID=A0A364NH32_STELY|nr:hypothetical protein DDE83_000139 [Stemphylium lycopersici]